jgi:hypothetical protein
LLGSLFDFLRDLAILAAAVGVAKWAWDWHTGTTERRDEAARTALAEERWRTDVRQWAERLEKRLDAVAAPHAETEARLKTKIAVHKVLQSTADPYLSFAEIESALARAAFVERAVAAGNTEVAAEVGEPESIKGDDLRRVLIELVGDGVIAQLDRDRYFIASDFETGEGSDTAPG